MSRAGMPGGGPVNDDLRWVAMTFAGIFLLIFFLLVLRMEFDKRSGKRTAAMTPTRNAAPVIQSVLDQG